MTSCAVRKFIVLSFIAASCCRSACGFDYESIRFYTTNGKPQVVSAHAVSPDGRYLAISFKGDTGSKPGVSIVDLGRGELLKQTGLFSFESLAFSSDSRKIFGAGEYAGVQIVDVETGGVERLRELPTISGQIGVTLSERNGKLLVGTVDRQFNPTVGDQIREGDEVLEINEGEKPVHHDDRDEWRTIAGKPLNDALALLAGKPGTWVRLRLVRRGSSEPMDAAVQRQWPPDASRSRPSRGESVTTGVDAGVLQFRSVDTLRHFAFASLRDVPPSGRHAVSPDAKRFAILSTVINGQNFCLEVHSLTSGGIEQAALLDASNFRDLRFTADSRLVLAGTRDTVEVFDVASGQWKEPVILTPKEEADEGRLVTRRIPLGLGLPGDLFTTDTDLVYDNPAALFLFDVSPSGTLAVASEEGEILLASLETKRRFGAIGKRILGAEPEFIRFTPSGDRLAAFANGMLHIIAMTNAGTEPAAAANEGRGTPK